MSSSRPPSSPPKVHHLSSPAPEVPFVPIGVKNSARVLVPDQAEEILDNKDKTAVQALEMEEASRADMVGEASEIQLPQLKPVASSNAGTTSQKAEIPDSEADVEDEDETGALNGVSLIERAEELGANDGLRESVEVRNEQQQERIVETEQEQEQNHEMHDEVASGEVKVKEADPKEANLQDVIGETTKHELQEQTDMECDPTNGKEDHTVQDYRDEDVMLVEFGTEEPRPAYETGPATSEQPQDATSAPEETIVVDTSPSPVVPLLDEDQNQDAMDEVSESKEEVMPPPKTRGQKRKRGRPASKKSKPTPAVVEESAEVDDGIAVGNEQAMHVDEHASNAKHRGQEQTTTTEEQDGTPEISGVQEPASNIISGNGLPKESENAVTEPAQTPIIDTTSTAETTAASSITTNTTIHEPTSTISSEATTIQSKAEVQMTAPPSEPPAPPESSPSRNKDVIFAELKAMKMVTTFSILTQYLADTCFSLLMKIISRPRSKLATQHSLLSSHPFGAGWLLSMLTLRMSSLFHTYTALLSAVISTSVSVLHLCWSFQAFLIGNFLAQSSIPSSISQLFSPPIPTKLTPSPTSSHPAAETVSKHIRLLHEYNDIRDIGQGLLGMIADSRDVRVGRVMEEFGVGASD